MKRLKAFCIILSSVLYILTVTGCQSQEQSDFSDYKRIADLATLECTYHNVAEVYNDGTDILFGINVGYKKAWFEYDGKVKLGIDTAKVKIEGPDENNVVTITVPKAQVLGLSDVDEKSFSDIYSDTGLFTTVDGYDQSEAFKIAQDKMRESAENNNQLIEQAQSRAETLLSQYVRNIGEAAGKTYQVKFIEAEQVEELSYNLFISFMSHLSNTYTNRRQSYHRAQESNMSEIENELAIANFNKLLIGASQLPGVHIDRKSYLTNVLRPHFSPEIISLAIETSPAAAGITPEQLNAIADGAIRFETTKVTALSTVSGIPGGLAMIGTIPADLTQYFAHILRIAQKLAFLYGWENIFEDNEKEIDDDTKNLLILFVGVMFGVNGATEAVSKVAARAAEVAAKKIPQRALTQGTIYPIVKKIAGLVGVKMTKDAFGKSISKAIPVIGAVVSGGMTLATFTPMCWKLKDHLSGLTIASPTSSTTSVIEPEVITVEPTESISNESKFQLPCDMVDFISSQEQGFSFNT